MALTLRPYCCPLALSVFLTIFTLCIISTSSSIHHDYCIIGAGPSGLQLGYFLQQKDRDYIIFERNNVSGTVYELKLKLHLAYVFALKSWKEYLLLFTYFITLGKDVTLLLITKFKTKRPLSNLFVNRIPN